MRQRMRGIPGLCALFLLCCLLSGCKEKADTWQKLYEVTGTWLASQNQPTVGSVGGEWLVVGLARSGRLTDQTAAAYRKEVEEYVCRVGRDRLHPVKSTENARLILGLTAAGGNPAAVGGQNLLNGLADRAYIKEQGVNGPIWALIALDCGRYSIEKEGSVTREELVEDILSQQGADGSWGFFRDASDVDMTAMALQALAPYREERVSAAIEKALGYLSAEQTAEGGYESYGVPNCESAAQVIVALCSLKIDPQKEDSFIKNGHTVMENLCGFATAEGGFCHQKDKPQTDAMATEQAYYALTAYDRYQKGLSPLYDMSR